MPINFFKIATVIGGAFLFTLFISLISVFVARNKIEDGQQQIIESLANDVSSVVEETSVTLERLNRIPYSDFCSDELLVLMRQIVFQSNLIKEIGYHNADSELICTSSEGRLPKPIRAYKPDAVTESGFELWFSVKLILFDLDYSGAITRLNRYNVVTDKFLPSANIPEHTQWEIIFRQDDFEKNIRGSRGLHARVEADIANDNGAFGDILLQQCSELIPYCVATRTNMLRLVEAWHMQIISVLVMAFFCLGLFVSNYLYALYNSPSARVRRGLNKSSLFPLFQPLVDMKTGKIIGCEVLSRFQDSNGAIYPDTFIPLISKLGLTVPFTRRIMQKSLYQLHRQINIPDNFKVNFNIFPRDINHINCQRVVQSAILNSRFKICFEITEDEVFNHEDTLSNVALLRSSGVEIAIDDFGTGYANLGQLQKIDFDSLKIDRSFVAAMEDESVRATLIPHIMEIAGQLEVYVVAEGIETQEQHDNLLELGVSVGQGWLYGKPMSASKLAALIASQGD